MKNFTLGRDILQSYFENVCKSFFIAYRQVKRLETKDKELEEKYPKGELEVVNILLDNSIPESLRKEIGLCSDEELKEKKKEYERLEEEYKQNSKDLQGQRIFWENELWQKCAKQVEGIIWKMKDQEIPIIVTSKIQIVVLMVFFMGAKLVDNEIIDISEKNLFSFPKDDMSQEFLKAYLSKDDDEMEKVIEKYF